MTITTKALAHLLAVAAIALPIAALATETPAPAASCGDLFDQSRHEHCWIGNRHLAHYAGSPTVVEGHRHMHMN